MANDSEIKREGDRVEVRVPVIELTLSAGLMRLPAGHPSERAGEQAFWFAWTVKRGLRD